MKEDKNPILSGYDWWSNQEAKWHQSETQGIKIGTRLSTTEKNMNSQNRAM